MTDVSYDKRPVNRYRLRALEKQAGKSVLDVGCGNGAYVLALKDKKEIHGVDYARFDGWQEAPGLFSVASAEDLSHIPDQSYDTVSCFETLEHLPHPEKALAHFKRIARQNVIVTVPNCEVSEGMRASSLTFGHYIDRTHVQFFTAASLTTLLEAAGFPKVKCSFVNPISLGYFLDEYLSRTAPPTSLKQRFHARLLKYAMDNAQKRKYFLTLLAVARQS